MTDLKDYLGKVWQTSEGWKADCPKCGRQKKLYWNEAKQCGICFHAGCAWSRGVYLKRALAHFTTDGLVVPHAPEVVESSKDSEVKLPEEFRLIRDFDRSMSETLYAYLISRGIPISVAKAANIGYCESGRFWGYLIFPLLNDEGEVVYWQARRFKNREPKFYNPKASNKSELVYRISSSIRPRRIIVVESIINALTLESVGTAGSTCIMAILGKTISEKQIQYAMQFEKRLTEIIVALDGDARSEAVDIAEKFWSEWRGAVKVAPIPDGEDINSLGREESFNRINDAEAFSKYKRIEMAARRIA